MEGVQGSWNLSNVKQHSLKVFHNLLCTVGAALCSCFFFVFFSVE